MTPAAIRRLTTARPVSRLWWLWQEDLRWTIVDALRCAKRCSRDAFGRWRKEAP